MIIEKLRLKYDLDFRENEPLAPFTTYKIGGPAKFFVQVSSVTELRTALQAAVDNKLPYFILGNGSNILVNDSGFDGLVIRLNGGELEFMGTTVKAFAGYYWPKFVLETIQHDFEGMEKIGNIPGSVGGCVRGNAGAYGVNVGNFVSEVEVLVVGEQEVGLQVLTKEECEFAYRESRFKKESNLIIARVTFELKLATTDKIERLKQVAEEGATRCAKQPLKFPSAGCSFKNLEYKDDYSQYKDWEVKGKLPAGRFIENAGLKGKQIGGAKVAEEHANFIINVGGATANDVIQLISLVKMRVRDEFGVQLEEEIQYVGF